MTARVPVVVCGGGPVGLTVALELAAWQVPVVVVERHRHPSPFPKGRALSTRTMEILRQLGLEDEVTTAGLPREATMHFFHGESLVAERFSRISNTPPPGGSPLSPTFTLACSQDRLEAVLRRHVAAHPCIDARFGTHLVNAGIDQRGASVELRAADGTTETLRCRWLVAADGAHSRLRDLAGIDRATFGQACDNVNILFDADLAPLVADRSSLVYTISNDHVHAGILVVDGRHRWLCNVVEPGLHGNDGEIDEAWCRAQVHHAIGRPVDVEVVAWQRWDARAANAVRYRHGALLLVGDAAHVATPYGGFGMNCGIADAHNLAWKLALHTRWGWDEAVVATYDAERRPIGERTMGESARRLGVALASHGDGRTRRGEVEPAPSDGLVLGGTYRSSAVLGDVAPDPDEDRVDRYQPACRPGARAPHVWLGEGRSVLDLFGPHFTALHATTAPPRVPSQLDGAPVVAVAVDDRLDPSGEVRQVYGLGAGATVVVRPDGVVTVT